MNSRLNKQQSNAVVDLIKQINNGSTETNVTLSNLLRLCMKLGSELNNDELLEWSRSELNGYGEEETLPDYRVFNVESFGHFFGPFGSELKNAAIPQMVIEKEHRDILFKAYMRQPTAELESLINLTSETGELLKSNWNADIVAYYQQKEIYTNGLALASAWMVISPYSISGALDTIRTRILEFAIQIAKELGLGIHDASADEIHVADDKVNTLVQNVFYGANGVVLDNHGVISQKNVSVVKGDIDSLKRHLTSLGLNDSLISELDSALKKDSKLKTKPGKATQDWLGKVTLMLGKGSLSLASNASGSLIADAILKYLGIS